MDEYDDDVAARRFEDSANLTPAGPGRRVRRSGSSRGLGAHVPVRFSAELIAAVKRLADVDGVTVSSWIRAVVRREVERRHPPLTEHTNGARLEFTNAPDTTRTVGRDAPLAEA